MRSLILVAGACLALAACTTAQVEKVESTTQAICTSAPLAQALYNTAVASGDNNRVNEIMNYLQAVCPTVLILIKTVPVKEPVYVPAPAPTPERG